ncbi:uncharacterized protein LOC123534316 isoform X3 [Mercenaria mercenaria]|uniref:uncharacterized protein LOC123534316 isoform X3 n=1 Tax=Mercenaria mercenaria TaxID=6596 RepID=UPI00234E8C83|nr:uncharacterized protein LOC123534316 isoform X3 [Mercenaria mercenaria]
MLKTEQVRTATYTARLDKSADQTAFVGSKRKPQYLDVALARGSNDLSLKDGTKNVKIKNVKKEKDDLGIKRGRNKVNVLSGNNVSNDVPKLSTGGNKTARKTKFVSGNISVEKPATFREKQKFESEKNQKLYQQLDHILSGKHAIPYPTESKESGLPLKVTKKEHIAILTKNSLYPAISKEAREKHDDSLSFRESNVPANKFLGTESEILHKRELQAEARLEKLEKIDDFSVGDFTVKSHVHVNSPKSEFTNRTQTVTVGIPVHAGNTISRRHIVADIPVYLPSFAGGNQPVQQVVKETGPAPIDKVYESTVPGATGKPFQQGAHPTHHAPEAFVGPVPGLDTVIAETQGGAPILNTYRSTGNPISERLLKEQAERERSLLEKNYFDVDPKSNRENKVKHLNEDGDKKSIAGTLLSDQGPRRTDTLTDGDNTRLTSEGYFAEKERQARLEKEAKILKKADIKNAFTDQELTGQKSSKAVPTRFDNQYQVDFYAQKTRSEIRSVMNFDREDSWIKRQLEKPSRSPVSLGTYRSQDNTYRARGYGNGAWREEQETYRGDGQTTYRGDGRATYRLNDEDRYKNRSYKLPDNIHGRDRYIDQVGKRDYEKEFKYDPRYEQERRDNERDKDRRDFEERHRQERDPRNNGRLEYERERRVDDRKGSYERGPLTSRYEPDRRNTRREEGETAMKESRFDRESFNLSVKESNRRDDTKSNSIRTTERDNYGRQTSDKGNSSSSKDEKVQYVIRNKSGNSRSEMRKSDMSVRSEPLPENIPPSSTELVRDRSPKSQYSKRSFESEMQTKSSPPAFQRQTPTGQEKSKGSMNEHKEKVGRLPTYETKADKSGRKSTDDLNKYFDEPDKPGSPSNVIPFYSDSINTYSRPKHDFRNGEMMTPVEEMSVKQSEEDDKDGKLSKTDKDSEKSKPIDSYVKSDRIKFLSSTENKHEIEEDRRSPWRKGKEQYKDGRSPSLKDEPPRHLIGSQAESPDITKIRGPDSVEQIRERIREKTIEKIREKQEERRREKTIDSQGPTDNKDDINAYEVDEADLNLDDVVTELDEKELYVCYLVTDNGEKIGPMRLDINDVQIGLPNPEKMKDLPEETGEVENEGMRNRQTGSHGLNEFSSRSHSMLMLTIDSEMQDPDDENLYITKRGKLTFVDLAGSEKVKDSNSTADTLVESNSINKSLLVLGNCISSLGDQKRRQGHIPYRDSKLTKLLADSLGGNGVTLMICCITPSSYHAPETMNTLRYASRAKKIRTKPVIKMDPREKLILSLKREIKVLRNENHYLRQQTGIPTKVKPKPKPNNDVKNPNDKKEPDAENLKKPSDVIRNYAKNKENLEFPAKPRGQLQKENDQKVMKIMKETNEKMRQGGNGADESGLYEMLQEYMVENEALRTENAEMQVNRDKVRQDQQLLYRDNEKLMKRVDDLERRLNQATTSWQSMPRQDSHRSRDHSPRGSPQYRGGGSGGKVVQAKFAQPPADLPLRDNPALRDPIYPGSPPQGYNSPTSNGRSKPSQQPATAPRSQPLKPPHRLADPIQQQRPAYEQNGPPYMNGNPGSHPAGHGFPAGHPAMQPGPGHHPGIGTQYRQPHIGSPNRPNGSGMYYNYDLRMDSRKSSTSSSSDAIRDMNEKLKQELAQLDGQIHHHHVYNQHKNTYGSQGSMR